MTAARETHTTHAALAQAYAPAPKIRVGILLVGAALSDPESTQAIDDALRAAGHTSLRRRAKLQPRAGENGLRVADVIAFIALYGHEYALVAFRSWPAARGHEADLIAAAKREGCRTIWEIDPGDPAAAGDAVTSNTLLRRPPGANRSSATPV